MKIKKKSGGGGASWMDTYGDMVTLLLCFFVLLYSMSTISEDKWKALVQSFNPDAVDIQMSPGGNDPYADVSDPPETSEAEETAQLEQQQEEIDEALEKLYQALKEYSEQNEMAKNMEVTKGDGYVFVSFNDAVFFDGDSYALRPEGEQVLSFVSEVLEHAVEYIDELRILGHTAQALPNRPNNPMTDRVLSASRAASTTVFIQQHTSLDPARIVSVGYGQHRPVDSNEAEETRKHNRRVEMIVTGRDVFDELGGALEEYASIRAGEGHMNTQRDDTTADTASDAGSEPAEGAETES